MPNYHFLFVPLNKYHALTACLLMKALHRHGLKSAFLLVEDRYRQEGARDYIKQHAPEFKIYSFSDFETGKCRTSCLVCFNDWIKVIRDLLVLATSAGVKTVGIIEGINDFLDVDTGKSRKPYQSVEYVCLTGEDDRRFFGDLKVYVCGVPRLGALLEEEVLPTTEPLVVINLNFTYNVLVDKRALWLDSVVEACHRCGYNFSITKHPAEKYQPPQAWLSTEDMYDTIRRGSVLVSRFSSAIIEALCLDRPVVYHNPNIEKVDKFFDPRDAYRVSDSVESLVKALSESHRPRKAGEIRRGAANFLQHHCQVTADPVKQTVHALMDILAI